MSLSRLPIIPLRGSLRSCLVLPAASVHTPPDVKAFRSHILPAKNKFKGLYGGRFTVTALPGDGIGPENFEHVQRIFTFAHVPVDFETVKLSSELAHDDLTNAIISIRRNGVALKGNIETKYDDPQFVSRNLAIRRRLDLFANVIHCVSVPSVKARHTDLDIVLIRENTEGEYSGLEHETQPGVVESLKIVTRGKIERIARFAFQYARAYGRTKVTAIHKANIQKLGDGLFLKIASKMAAEEFPDIPFETMIVDNASMQLVSKPQQFNGGILLTPNLYGNIISNIACGLVGGPGLVSGMNIGEQFAVFETATRNTGSSLVAQNVANPTAFIRASADMLAYLGLKEYSDLISDALFKTLSEDRVHTQDIGGSAQSTDVVESVLKYIEHEMRIKGKRIGH
ncbi:Isocitrate dehydrogenase [NAD] subunit, mitochondrial [Aphelenchoides fujianensis]|nr:Isocitrate dehydrogenase [NAD] subunit, mitochondrial [Aphelenchoides fujianensis]